MALATRCPHCQTTFRVAHDQLKLRAGLVRCGACKEIFNGVEHLLRPEETQKLAASPKSPTDRNQEQTLPSAVPAPAPASQGPTLQEPSLPASAEPAPPAQTAIPQAEADFAITNKTADSDVKNVTPSPDAPDPQHQDFQQQDVQQQVNDPLQRMTLMDFTAFEEEIAENAASASNTDTASDSMAEPDGDGKHADSSFDDTDDELSQAIDDLQRKPWRRARKPSSRPSLPEAPAEKSAEVAEPNFVKHARRQKKYGKALRIAMAAGCLILLIALATQSLYVFRTTIAASMPQFKPYLVSLCGILDCSLGLPAQINKVSIESSELQSPPASPGQFTLTVLMNNQSKTNQAWPHIELTLNDANEKPIARRVFLPQDYLPARETAIGFPAESEKTVKLSFELLQLKASGYRVYLFYP